MTWLIAEDEADIRNLVALMCQMWGHTTLTFENGQRVWEWLDSVEREENGKGAQAEPAAQPEPTGQTEQTGQTGQTGQTEQSAQTAQAEQKSELPELILMDIRMPGKRGNELAHRMRTIDALKRKPIILMTAYTLNDQERKEMMEQDGVDLIVNKPLPDFEQLRLILHNIVDQKQAANDQPTQ